MPALKNLLVRIAELPEWGESFDRNQPAATAIAERMATFHNSGIQLQTFNFETSELRTEPNPRPRTLRSEKALGLPRSVYLYAGRCPQFGSIAMAFGSSMERSYPGSASPLDSGGLVQPDEELRPHIWSPLLSALADRLDFFRRSILPLQCWRKAFARFLAAYFAQPLDYWRGRPSGRDPETLFERANANQWPSWTFEIRILNDVSFDHLIGWASNFAQVTYLESTILGDGPVPEGMIDFHRKCILDACSDHYPDRLVQWHLQDLGLPV